MTFRHISSAALTLGLLLPQVALAQDAPITPVLSTTMQRVCAVETTRLLLMNAGQALANPQPAVESRDSSFRASRSDEGWVLQSTSAGSGGEQTLRIETAANGATVAATLSGASIEADSASPGADVSALALAMADDVPERLLLGRTFDVGDSYYPKTLRRSLLNRMVAGFGMPVDMNGSIDIRYEGEVEFEGRRAWRFAGQITGAGQITINARGRTITFNHLTQAVAIHDAETGLLLNYHAEADDRTEVDASPFRHQRKTEVFTCDIVPQ